MVLENITPFIRFASKWNYYTLKENVSTYDCRMLYLRNGSGKIIIENTELEVTSGLLVIYQPGITYSLIPNPSFEAIAIDFDYTEDYSNEQSIIIPVKTDSFDKLKSHNYITFDDFTQLNYPIIVPDAFFICGLLNELCEEFNGKKMFYLQKSSLLLKNIIYEIIRQLESANKNTTIVQNIIKYISEHYSEHITNESIAKKMHYSAGYLNRLMLSNTGMTLHGYITNVRLDSALKLLASTDMTISDIAFKTGFYSSAHFSNAFKSAMGVSPSTYKRR